MVGLTRAISVSGNSGSTPEITLLYENPKPKQSMGAATLVNDVSGYDTLLIETTYVYKADGYSRTMIDVKDMEFCIATYAGIGRAFTLYGYVLKCDNGGSQHSDSNIPYRVWGIKGLADLWGKTTRI